MNCRPSPEVCSTRRKSRPPSLIGLYSATTLLFHSELSRHPSGRRPVMRTPLAAVIVSKGFPGTPKSVSMIAWGSAPATPVRIKQKAKQAMIFMFIPASLGLIIEESILTLWSDDGQASVSRTPSRKSVRAVATVAFHPRPA